MDKLHPADRSFIDSLMAIVTDHLSQEGFGVEQLAEAANLNRISLYRKVKALTGENVSQLISEIGLKGTGIIATGAAYSSRSGLLGRIQQSILFQQVFSRLSWIPARGSKEKGAGS